MGEIGRQRVRQMHDANKNAVKLLEAIKSSGEDLPR